MNSQGKLAHQLSDGKGPYRRYTAIQPAMAYHSASGALEASLIDGHTVHNAPAC